MLQIYGSLLAKHFGVLGQKMVKNHKGVGGNIHQQHIYTSVRQLSACPPNVRQLSAIYLTSLVKQILLQCDETIDIIEISLI